MALLKSRRRMTFTTSPTVGRALDVLLRSGLYGRTRNEVCERLVCDGVVRILGGEQIRAIAEEVKADA